MSAVRSKKTCALNCRKIAVIGCGGSGKSYFAGKLSKLMDLPCYHLDMLFWKPNWVETPIDDFREIVRKVLSRDEWIIDGNYGKILEDRFVAADLIYFLDMPTKLCIDSERARRESGKARKDLPDYLIETEDATFIDYIKNFNSNQRQIIIDLINKYPNTSVKIFTSRAEVDRYLAEFCIGA